MAAYNYPLIGAFWTTLVVAMLAVLLYLFFRVLVDLFRSPDMGAFAKVLWLVFIILVPFIGVIGYLGWRGHAMSQRDVKAARARRLERNAAGGPASTSWYDL
jgi:hypothetical protein